MIDELEQCCYYDIGGLYLVFHYNFIILWILFVATWTPRFPQRLCHFMQEIYIPIHPLTGWNGPCICKQYPVDNTPVLQKISKKNKFEPVQSTFTNIYIFQGSIGFHPIGIYLVQKCFEKDPILLFEKNGYYWVLVGWQKYLYIFCISLCSFYV